MARKSSGTILQEELYPASAAPAREELDDARLIDLHVGEASPFPGSYPHLTLPTSYPV